MLYVVMGCGRVGASLARALERAGHDVAVIDQDPRAFDRIGAQYRAKRITGVGFDRDTLTAAGIERASGFAAVSSGDNSNILAARVARETFGVENVVARIYDMGRAEIYERLGIPTVATVKWTSDQILRRMVPSGHLPEFTDPSGKIVLAEVHLEPAWVGERYTRVEEVTGARVAYVTRDGEGILPLPRHVYQAGDIVHLVVPRADLDTVERILALAPPAE